MLTPFSQRVLAQPLKNCCCPHPFVAVVSPQTICGFFDRISARPYYGTAQTIAIGCNVRHCSVSGLFRRANGNKGKKGRLFVLELGNCEHLCRYDAGEKVVGHEWEEETKRNIQVASKTGFCHREYFFETPYTNVHAATEVLCDHVRGNNRKNKEVSFIRSKQ